MLSEQVRCDPVETGPWERRGHAGRLSGCMDSVTNLQALDAHAYTTLKSEQSRHVAIGATVRLRRLAIQTGPSAETRQVRTTVNFMPSYCYAVTIQSTNPAISSPA